MIKDIEIQNFRCFEQTKIEGFERVNLIGGKNNSGKTALLEAILLNQSPQPKSIFLLRQLRQESEEFSKAYPEKAWDNLFFTDGIKQNGKITIENQKNQQNSNQYQHQLIELNSQLILYDNIYENNNNTGELEKDLPIKYLSDNFNKGSLLTITVALAGLSAIEQSFRSKHSNNYRFIMSSINQGIKLLSIKDTSNDSTMSEIDLQSLFHFNRSISLNKKAIYISPLVRYSSQVIIEEYSKAVFEDSDNYKSIINILQTIDSLIEELNIYCIGKPLIYIKKANQKKLPLSMFGDAINRVIEIILKIINNQSSIILIDEIENGIHYTNHRDFWKALFKLSKELDVQIFATTHSLEMIQAFRDVGLKDYADSGAYFEMTRHYKTNQIIGIKRDLETLDYAIEHGKGVRGE